MREEVELLEDHPHLLPVLVHIRSLVGDVISLKINVAAGGLFQKIQAAKEGRFA